MTRTSRSKGRGRTTAVGLAALALLMAAVPYLRGLGLEPDDRRFMGLLGGVDDNNVYLALIRQAEEGSWLFVNTFTPEPSRPALFNLLYLGLGRLGRWTGLPPIAVHHLFGVLATLLLAIVAYRFFGRAFHDERFRVAGVALTLFASGFFGLVGLLHWVFDWNLTSVDSWLVELSAFHCVLVYPHFLFASALLILTVDGVDRALSEGRLGGALQAVGAGSVLLFSHAFDLAVGLGAMGLFALVLFLRDGRRGAGRRLVLLGVMVGPIAVGALVTRSLLRAEPAWGDAVHRLVFPAPEPAELLLGLGLTAILALVFLLQGEHGPAPASRGARADRILLSRCWVLAVLLLLYQPALSWQFHLLNGIQVPLSLLALDGLRRRALVGRRALHAWARRVRPRVPRRWLASSILVVLCAAAGLSAPAHLLWYWRAVEKESSTLYLSKWDLEALDWLDRHSRRGEVVLAAPETAHFVPRLSGNRVVAGEDMLTTDYSARAERVRRFYGAAGREERLSLLREFGVRYIFAGEAERRLGDWDPAELPGWELAFSNRRAAVYRIARTRAPLGGRPVPRGPEAGHR